MGNNFNKDLIALELYKIHTNLTSDLDSRQVLINRYYAIIITALIAGLSVLMGIGDQSVILSTYSNFPIDKIIISVGFIGILLSYIWYINVCKYFRISYRNHNALIELESNIGQQFLKKKLLGDFSGNIKITPSMVDIGVPIIFIISSYILLLMGLSLYEGFKAGIPKYLVLFLILFGCALVVSILFSLINVVIDRSIFRRFNSEQ